MVPEKHIQIRLMETCPQCQGNGVRANFHIARPVLGALEVASTLQLQEYLPLQANAPSAMAKGVSVHSRAILAMVRAVVRSKRICR